MESKKLTDNSNILITGCTGLIGGELLQKLISQRSGKGKTWVLVRAKSYEHASQRLEERLNRSSKDFTSLAGMGNNVRAVPGDVTLARWGLSEDCYSEIFSDLDIIIHCASDTSFLLSDSVLECNVSSTRNLIEFVKSSDNVPLVVYISTAANIGNITNSVVTEEMTRDPENGHHNLYTRSKAACEVMLNEANIPTLILRPSIVLSAGIEDSQFASSILWMIPMVYHFNALPIDGNSRIDIVPVDFVVNSILELLKKDELKYSAYHISAGESQTITTGEAFKCTEEFYKRSCAQFIPPRAWDAQKHRNHINSKRRRELYHRIKYYFPFLNMDVVYDNSRLAQEIGVLEIQPFQDYVNLLLAQITDSHALEESYNP